MGRLNKRTWGRLDQNAMYRDMNLSNNKCKNKKSKILHWVAYFSKRNTLNLSNLLKLMLTANNDSDSLLYIERVPQSRCGRIERVLDCLYLSIHLTQSCLNT